MRTLLKATLLMLAATSVAALASERIEPDPRATSDLLRFAGAKTQDWVPAAAADKNFRIVFPGKPCSPCWGDPVIYSSFSQFGLSYQALRYDGRWVTLLIPAVHPRANDATADRIRVLVDRLDILYASYRELLDWEPEKYADPLGKQVFAVLPNDSGYRGNAFAPGDSSEYANLVLAELAVDDDQLGEIWVHELAHNFDQIYLWDYGPDPYHDWTTLLRNWFAGRQAHMDDRRRVWSSIESDWLRWHWQPFLSNSALTWELCAATSSHPVQCESVLYLAGSLGVEIGRHSSPLQMRAWLRGALAAQNQGTYLNGSGARSDFLLALLADVTQSDTRCIATHFRWFQGAGLSGAAQYSAPFAGCLDGDQDQAIRFDDCDDLRADVHPGAPELADHFDNDCNGRVDDLTVDESAFSSLDFSDSLTLGTAVGNWPVVIRGTLPDRPAGEAQDLDHISLATPISGALSLRLCASDARVQVTDADGYGFSLAANAGACAEHTFPDLVWRDFVLVRGSVSPPGANYVLEIDRVSSDWPRPPAVKTVRAADGSIKASIDPSVVPGGVDGAQLRWLQSGSGFVKTGPASDPLSADAPVLASSAFAANGRPLQLRAQLWRDGMPIEEPSNPQLLPDMAYVTGVPPGAALSGAWYSPQHDGEGFLIEMLDPDRALIYWFTYDPTAWGASAGSAGQHWMLADAAVVGSSLQGSLLQVEGGSFGTTMNPAQLTNTTVGEISLVFADDQRGTVHFRVGGRTGEYAIERLTRLQTGAGARGVSGSWYQHAYRGQGLIVQETGADGLLAVLFSFAADGKPAWAVLQGTLLANGEISFASAPMRTRGGLFGRGFRNASVTRTSEGNANLNLACNSGSLTIRLPSISAASHTLTLERLTRPLGIVCP